MSSNTGPAGEPSRHQGSLDDGVDADGYSEPEVAYRGLAIQVQSVNLHVIKEINMADGFDAARCSPLAVVSPISVHLDRKNTSEYWRGSCTLKLKGTICDPLAQNQSYLAAG